ncbi:DUF6011 domain-containing protein [Nonomuraea rubra]|uniref:Uncharacterized protein n=1 Tax=Nonomuraea rubra TaxID=46180 RepID=A0A7X0P6G9_9ACTN|nr:DUF6011 domain-containing protein [Nonomuraea rubra]MBB6556188.1 hypothetical protein [Nonomuraea rubra]
MNLLDLDEPDTPAAGETPTVGRCRCCRHKLQDPVSLAYGIGPDCRKALGIVSRKPVRITGVPTGWDVDGQTDLLEETA